MGRFDFRLIFLTVLLGGMIGIHALEIFSEKRIFQSFITESGITRDDSIQSFFQTSNKIVIELLGTIIHTLVQTALGIQVINSNDVADEVVHECVLIHVIGVHILAILTECNADQSILQVIVLGEMPIQNSGARTNIVDVYLCFSYLLLK